jgi:hypothetical protein
VVATPIAVNARGLEGPAKPGGRHFKRAVGIAIGMVALGASAALFVGLFENQPVTSAGGPTARAVLPADLFAPPAAPKPRIVVRYMAPRNAPRAAPVATSPAAPVATSPAAPVATSPTARPTPSGRPRPSPSPSPSPRGDD